jgi:hypothetical protein
VVTDRPSAGVLEHHAAPSNRLRRRDPSLAANSDQARVLRSVLMKPEHEAYAETLHRELVRITRTLGREAP